MSTMAGIYRPGSISEKSGANAGAGKRIQQTLRYLSEASFSPDILVNCARLVAASFGLVAVWLDPTRPSGEFGNVQAVLCAYLAFAAILPAVTGPLKEMAPALRWTTHAIDLAALSLLVLLSEELDSPFFVFFTFTLMTAALQWGMGGILATASALQLLLAASAWSDLQDGDSELNIFIMRSAYCWVSATMLGYFVTYREGMRHRLARLAAWQPSGAPTENGIAFSRTLDGALEILGARGIVIFWKLVDAPTGFAVIRKPEGYDQLRVIDGPLIDDIAAASHSKILGPEDPFAGHVMRVLEMAAPSPQNGEHPLRWCSLCLTRLSSTRYHCVVLVIDGSGEKGQLLSIAKIVTLRIAAHFEQRAAASEQAEAAGLLEREALARNLHDGVLQHLTAAALHVKVARGDLAGQSDRLAIVAAILLDQQQQIRKFVEAARTASKPQNQPLVKRLQRLATTLSQQWGCDIAVDVAPKLLRLEASLVAELCLLFSEAAANAVRHGRADRISWTIVAQDRAINVSVEDNGCGLPQAMDDHSVPRSLEARVESLGGDLEIASSSGGLKLTMNIPLEGRVS